MISILQSIGNFFVSLANLLINLVSGIAQMLVMIPSALTMLTNSIAYMPTILVAFAIGIVTVSIVYLVIGR